MKLTENFIKQDSPTKLWDWGQYSNLKGEYKNEHASEVKTYKLSKEEIEEYLKNPKKELKGYKKKRK